METPATDARLELGVMWPVARMGEVTEVSPLYGTEIEAEAMAAPVESAQHIRPVEAEPLILGEISTEASSYDDDDDPPCGCCCEGSKGGAECCGHDHVWTSCWAVSAVAAMVVFWWMYQTWYETFRAPREPGEVHARQSAPPVASARLPPVAARGKTLYGPLFAPLLAKIEQPEPRIPPE